MFDTPTCKEIIGGVGFLVALGASVPYLYGTIRGTIIPHPFSRFVWMILSGIVAAAQIDKGAGAGAWVAIEDSAMCALIAFASLRYGFKDITRSDWFAFLGALMAIPLWVLTQDPTFSVVLVSCIDTLAFYPTFRKAYYKPYEDSILLYAAACFAWAASIEALQSYSIATVLFPVVGATSTACFVTMTLWRRRVVKQPLG